MTTDDGQGGNSNPWSDVYTCWADMQDFPHGRGFFRKMLYMQLYPQANRLVVIRYQTQYHIDATMRIKYVKGTTTHYLKILGTENPNEANVSILLYCQEDQAKGAN